MSLTNTLKKLLKKSEQTAKKVADVNKDGKVNTKDAKAAGAKVTKSASKATKSVKKKVAPKKK